MEKKNGFAFVVHPRGYGDLVANIDFLKIVPRRLAIEVLKSVRPFVVSKITGLKSLVDGSDVPGWVIGIPLLPKHIIEDRKLIRKRIDQAIQLAYKKGASVVGLGGLLGSVVEGGAGLSKKDEVLVTAGRAYTTHIVIEYAKDAIEKFGLKKEETVIAVVGAAGGVGSTVTKVLSRERFKKIILIDLERKLEKIKEYLEKNLKSETEIIITHQINAAVEADIIITATNAPEAVLKSEDIKTGAVIVDDAQPSDISPDVVKNRKDVAIIEAGVITTENLRVGTNFRLANRNEIYCCLGEVMALASSQDSNLHYSPDNITLEVISQIANSANQLGFKLAPYQSFGKIISTEDFINIRQIINSRSK